MAYELKQNEDDEQKQAAGMPIQVTGASTPMGSGQVNKNPNIPTSVNNYTDVASYLDANQPQSENLGANVSQYLGGVGEAAKTGVDTAGQAFQRSVQGGTPTIADADLNAAIQNPAGIAPEEAADITKAAKGEYTGAKTIQDIPEYLNAQQGVSNANQTMNSAGTVGGREQILNSFEQNPTQGITKLNSMLLSGNKNAMGAVKDTATKYSGLNDYLDKANAGATDFANTAEANRQTQAGNIQKSLTGAENDIKTAVDTKASTNNALAQKFVDAVSNGDLKADDFTPEELAKMGVDPTILGNENIIPYNTSGTGVTDFVNPNNMGVENYATPEDVAKYNALAGMAGNDKWGITPTASGYAPRYNDYISNLKGQHQAKLDADAAALAQYAEESGHVLPGPTPRIPGR